MFGVLCAKTKKVFEGVLSLLEWPNIDCPARKWENGVGFVLYIADATDTKKGACLLYFVFKEVGILKKELDLECCVVMMNHTEVTGDVVLWKLCWGI